LRILRSSDANQRRHTVGLASITVDLPASHMPRADRHAEDETFSADRTADTLRNILTPLREGIKTRHHVHTSDCM